MTHSIPKPLPAIPGLLAGFLSIVLASCGSRATPPTAQTSPTVSPSIASPSPSVSPSLKPIAPSPTVSPSLTTSPSPTVSPSLLALPNERSEEARAQLALMSLTSTQQARFAEKREFAPAIADLDKKWKPLERYDIAMQPQGKEKVIITAKAKDAALKSYTAVVYGFSGDSAVASTVICGTLQPSQTPPAFTAPAPATPTEQVFCPSGTYRSDGIAESPAPKKP